MDAGTGMFVWGGRQSNKDVGDGGIYIALGDAWTAGQQDRGSQPRVLARRVWTGTKVIVWGGGTEAAATTASTGGRYNPGRRTPGWP